jgi:hypothetical protein
VRNGDRAGFQCCARQVQYITAVLSQYTQRLRGCRVQVSRDDLEQLAIGIHNVNQAGNPQRRQRQAGKLVERRDIVAGTCEDGAGGGE